MGRGRKTPLTARLQARQRAAVATRALIILRAAEGRTNTNVAALLGVSVVTVCKWRGQYIAAGLEGLLANPRSGSRLPEQTAHKVRTRRARGDSTRAIAEDIKVSQSSVVRLIQREP